MPTVESNPEYEHLDLALTPEQWRQICDFYPSEFKANSDNHTVHLIAYWRGERYGVVHASLNDSR